MWLFNRSLNVRAIWSYVAYLKFRHVGFLGRRALIKTSLRYKPSKAPVIIDHVQAHSPIESTSLFNCTDRLGSVKLVRPAQVV